MGEVNNSSVIGLVSEGGDASRSSHSFQALNRHVGHNHGKVKKKDGCSSSASNANFIEEKQCSVNKVERTSEYQSKMKILQQSNNSVPSRTTNTEQCPNGYECSNVPQLVTHAMVFQLDHVIFIAASGLQSIYAVLITIPLAYRQTYESFLHEMKRQHLEWVYGDALFPPMIQDNISS